MASDTVQPFLKWAGGKLRILPALLLCKPKQFGTYHEPFMGSGALFFRLSPASAYLSDANERLIRTYRAVRDNVEDVLNLLLDMRAAHCEEYFYQQRSRDIDGETDVGVAAWMIYLNRTCYNGLYRVNKRGRFNVPCGRNPNPDIYNPDRLRSCSRALHGAHLDVCDYTVVLDRAEPNDFVYFDPPYIPVSKTSRFSSYTRHGFNYEDHCRLRDTALELKDRGVHVMLSNSWCRDVLDLYGSDAFKVKQVTALRSINCNTEYRGKIFEALIL